MTKHWLHVADGERATPRHFKFFHLNRVGGTKDARVDFLAVERLEVELAMDKTVRETIARRMVFALCLKQGLRQICRDTFSPMPG
jgi:hypothetical protein